MKIKINITLGNNLLIVLNNVVIIPIIVLILNYLFKPIINEFINYLIFVCCTNLLIFYWVSIFARTFLKVQKEIYKNFLSVIIIPLSVVPIIFDKLFYVKETSFDFVWSICLPSIPYIWHELVLRIYNEWSTGIIEGIISGNIAMIHIAIILIVISRKNIYSR